MLAIGPSIAVLVQAAPASPGSGFSFLPIVLMFVLAWFLLIRPVQKQRKEQEAMRGALKSGDAVVTAGGLHGVVTKVRDDRLVVRIADGVQVEVSKSAIAGVVSPKDGE